MDPELQDYLKKHFNLILLIYFVFLLIFPYPGIILGAILIILLLVSPRIIITGVCAIIGSYIGFLFRPSVPFYGRLPYEAVITRGGSLKGFEILFTSYAEASFNYLIIGALVGGIIGWFSIDEKRKN